MAKSYAIASLQILMMLLIASSAQSAIRTTEFTVYIHEYFTGPNQSNFPVAGLSDPPELGKLGTVAVVDNLVTEGISDLSPVVGRIQGFAAVVSLDNQNGEGLTSLLFTSGEYNGSTVELKALSRPVPVNEFAVIGGTKQFRFATGYATAEVINEDEDHLLIEFYLHIKQDLQLLKDGNRKKASKYSKYTSIGPSSKRSERVSLKLFRKSLT